MDAPAEADFAGFVARRHRSLARCAFVLVGDAGRAEDLVQDALYKTFVAWDRPAVTSAAESYVRTTMVRMTLRWRALRRLSVEQLLDDALDGDVDQEVPRG